MKKNISLLGEWIKKSLSHQIQQLNTKKISENEMRANAYNSALSLELQYVLGDILSHTKISLSLSALRSWEDILPCGFNCMLEKTYYYFTLPKATEEPLSIVIVNRITENINRAIKTRRDHMFNYASMLDDYSRSAFYMQNRLLYNGFFVADSKDDYDRIMISVSLN